MKFLLLCIIKHCDLSNERKLFQEWIQRCIACLEWCNITSIMWNDAMIYHFGWFPCVLPTFDSWVTDWRTDRWMDGRTRPLLEMRAHPHLQPYPNTHSNIHKQFSKTLVFPLFDSCWPTIGPLDNQTNGRMDKASYGVACLKLKNEKIELTNVNCVINRRVVSYLGQFYVFDLLMHSRNHRTVYFTAFFSVIEKKIWNQIWIPQTISYKSFRLLGFTIRFGDTNHDFLTTSPYSLFCIKFYGQKKIILVIPIKDLVDCGWIFVYKMNFQQRLCRLSRFANSDTFFWHLNLLDFPLASCLPFANNYFHVIKHAF